MHYFDSEVREFQLHCSFHLLFLELVEILNAVLSSQKIECVVLFY